ATMSRRVRSARRPQLAHTLEQHIEPHEVRFLSNIILRSVRRRLHDMLRDSYVHALEFRYPKPRLGYRASRNFSQKLVVIRIHLLENRQSAGGPHKIDAPAWGVI